MTDDEPRSAATTAAGDLQTVATVPAAGARNDDPEAGVAVSGIRDDEAGRRADTDGVAAGDSTGVSLGHHTFVRTGGDLARLIFGLALGLTGLVFANTAEDVSQGLAEDLAVVAGLIPTTGVQVLVGLVQLLAIALPVVLVVTISARRQWRLLGTVVAAAGFAALLGALLNRFGAGTVPLEISGRLADLTFLTGAAFPSAPYLAAAIAVGVGSSPWQRFEWRRATWYVVALITVLRLLTATAVPLNLIVTVAIGMVAGSGALLAFGAPLRLVDARELIDCLRRGGLRPTRVELVDVSTRGAVPWDATLADGQRVFVKALGPDQRNVRLLSSAYRTLRVRGRGERRSGLSANRAVEHEALLLALAHNRGIACPKPVFTDELDGGWAVLATEHLDARSLAELDPDRVDDTLLEAVWTQVAALHQLRIAHGALTAGNVVVTADGAPVLVDFVDAHQAATDNDLAIDTAELLVSMAATWGAARAVSTAVEAVGTDAVVAAMPVVQPLALTSETRSQVKADKDLLEQVRNQIVDATGTEQFALEKLERVSGRQLLMLGATVMVAYLLLGQLSSTEDLWGAITGANWALIPPLALVTTLTFPAAALGLVGASPLRIPWGRTTVLQLAQTFLNRFTPANAGGMAVRVRFLQVRGVDVTQAAAAVGLTSAASGVMQVVIMVTFFAWAGSSSDVGVSMPSALAVAVLVGVIVVAAAIVLLTPWGRRVVLDRLVDTVRKAWDTVGTVARHPVKLAQLFGGMAASKILFIIAFDISMKAFGVDLPFAAVGALYLTATTVASAAPTPGGLGAIEAALVAGLTGVGVDNTEAVSIVLVFRLFTFWFPTLPGWLAFGYLTRSEEI